MLTPERETVIFQNTFTTVVTASAGTDTGVGSIFEVIPSYVDPGVTVSVNTDSVTISGAYQSIIPITWYWKDLNDQIQSGSSVPPVGTYEKIIQVDSPPSLSTICSYTITSAGGKDVFIHEVTLGSYNKIKDALNAALAGQPTPPMP